MLKAISSVSIAITLAIPTVLHAQRTSSWLCVPALSITSTPTGTNAHLGSGISIESFLYGRYLAGGLSAQLAWDKFLGVNGFGYVKVMPRMGFGFYQDDRGVMLGGSYGLLIEGTPGDNPSLPGAAWGLWAYVMVSKKIALDFNADFGKQLHVGRVGVTLFSWLTLNVSHFSLNGSSLTYVYPGFALRKEL